MISLQKISRYYQTGERSVRALEDISLEIEHHEFVAIVGPSGCGKSTLLHLIAGLDRPTTGEIVVDNLNLTKADDAQLTEFRRRRLGLVFQFFNLLPTMNALENVSLPLLLQGVAPNEATTRAEELLGTRWADEPRQSFCASIKRRRTTTHGDRARLDSSPAAPHRG